MTRAAALLWLLLASPAWADEAPPAPQTGAGLSPEDEEILEVLELLIDLELLQSWDPGEDLPIPLSAEKPRGEGP
ncbi:MAG: hypothetical protein V3V67_15340 [Myxococcota bacterium]